MAKMGEDGVIAVAGASPGRRIVACGIVYALGAILLYVTLVQPPSLGWMIFMLAFAVAVLVLAERLRRATMAQLVLRPEGLSTGEGELIAAMDDIVGVDRGAFAFKPSNGFTLRLRNAAPRRWAPGVWWRLGRFLGVGGVVSAGQAKFMAEQIGLILAVRDDPTLK